MSGLALSLTRKQTLDAMRSFLLAVLPAGVEVLRGQVNRVAEARTGDFVMMTPILRERLAWNTDEYEDVLFQASIAGIIMTVSSVQYGSIREGSTVFGVNVADNTQVAEQLTGPEGGAGTYEVSISQSVTAQAMAAGIKTMLQPSKVTIQLDVHGPASYDNAQIISTTLRDEYAIDKFKESGFSVVPLYADVERETAYLNGEQQVESNWSIDAVLQCNPVVTAPQQFADALELELIDVDVIYPPE